MDPNYEKYSTANPTLEFMNYKGIEKEEHIDRHYSNVEQRDLLMAILKSADVICQELRLIRNVLEKQVV